METTTRERDKSESIKMISQINRVDGFYPYSVTERVEYNSLETGEREVDEFITVTMQLAHFRLKYPQGAISESVIEYNENFARARCEVYADPGKTVFLASSEAVRDKGGMQYGGRHAYLDWAQTAARSRALLLAGFGLEGRCGGELFEGARKADVDPERKQEKSETKDEGKPKTMTPEEAGTVKVTFGEYKGQPLATAAQGNPTLVKYIAEKIC